MDTEKNPMADNSEHDNDFASSKLFWLNKIRHTYMDMDRDQLIDDLASSRANADLQAERAEILDDRVTQLTRLLAEASQHFHWNDKSLVSDELYDWCRAQAQREQTQKEDAAKQIIELAKTLGYKITSTDALAMLYRLKR